MLCLFALAKCFSLTCMIHVRVHNQIEPKPSSPLRNSISKKFDGSTKTWLQVPEKVDMLTQYIESGDEEIGVVSAVKRSQNKFCCPVNGNIILSDLLLILFKINYPRCSLNKSGWFQTIYIQCAGTVMVCGSLPPQV